MLGLQRKKKKKKRKKKTIHTHSCSPHGINLKGVLVEAGSSGVHHSLTCLSLPLLIQHSVSNELDPVFNDSFTVFRYFLDAPDEERIAQIYAILHFTPIPLLPGWGCGWEYRGEEGGREEEVAESLYDQDFCFL